MPSDQNSAKSIFLSALEIPSAAARREYLAAACGDNGQLLGEVQRLLDHQAQSESFLESPAASDGLAATVDASSKNQLGRQIGVYKIRELIGEGGMGAVYLAEQERPLRRKVALKVIKPGMDSKAVLGRFEAERNALALMNHPHIAKVLDAGTTEQGRPYFVMELVNGIPVTEYCDDQKLPIRERLRLFVDVCSAIQHAHQKGIIHRDIKPSNVLVTELDGKPIAKVIDFGVAKALNQSLTEHSIYTAFQTVIGTPLYMSPEQASFSAVDVDTRSDVYSLGVLLYELLTGTTPFSSEDLKRVAQEEFFRLIREQEPPRPSNRISSLGGTATKISQLRRTVPDELGRSVKGDLDWIVMKALSKERGRRYKSVDYFAEDIGRYLQDQPINARPPSVGYVAGRFVKRNATTVCFAMVVFTMSFVLVGVWLRGYLRETQLANKYRENIFQSALMKIMAGDDPNSLIAEARKIEMPKYQILLLDGQKALYNGEPREAVSKLREALKIEPDNVQANAMLAIALYHCGQLLEGVPQREKAVESIGHHSDAHEKLFLAHAGFLESENALKEIGEYLEQNSSPVGLLIRADLRAWHVNYTGNSVETIEALRDVEAAKRLIGETAYSLAVELWGRTQVSRAQLELR